MIMSIKTCRYLIVYALFVLCSCLVAGVAVAAESNYPDLLGEETIEMDVGEGIAEPVISDPLEPMNRVFFKFNDVLYEWVLKPVSKGYSWVLPLELREAFGNFFTNIAMPIRLINSLLQGDLEKSGVVLERFLINSTLGVYGLADVANQEFEIEPRKGDFDQTLGKWGLGSGIYLNWPVFGPSSVRGTFGLVADAYSHPIPYLSESRAFDISYRTTVRINDLSLHPELYDDLKKYSLDPYVAVRQAYVDYRNAVVSGK